MIIQWVTVDARAPKRLLQFVGFDLHALLEGVEAEHRGFEDTHRIHIGLFRNFQPSEGIGRIDEESAEVFAAQIGGGSDGGAEYLGSVS